ncbi:MAG: DNA-binding protein [Bacteroidales bacterium]|nr:DNA-binding protein [Bacteroidales bacterium]MCF8387120.1 DNA-binding protein [Bacteroidales bacterium]MCF8398010.1 DNA-binding protein [Bacteroidales bacterium]
MAKKKTFVLRINPEVFRELEKWAVDEIRSTNGQVEWIISKALKEARRYPKNESGKGEKEKS